jgi:hypothetical protein
MECVVVRSGALAKGDRGRSSVCRASCKSLVVGRTLSGVKSNTCRDRGSPLPYPHEVMGLKFAVRFVYRMYEFEVRDERVVPSNIS